MSKPNLTTIPEFYHKYVQLVAEENVADALEINTQKLIPVLHSVPAEKWDYRYSEGKWSIKEMVQHMIDTERIFSYRALCFSRGEKQSLPGFDENDYATASNAGKRTKEELIEEFKAVRTAVLHLFGSFDNEQLSRTGIANNNPVSVEGIGYITVGHVLHHLNILRDRYLQ